jgi:hypothetical protein
VSFLSHYFTFYVALIRFTNLTYDTPAPGTAGQVHDREMNTVQIVKRGTTVGYDNPGFDSPMDFFKRSAGPKLSSMNWPDPVICEGSSTPAVSRAINKGRDSDSAFQEPSTAVSCIMCRPYFNYYNPRHLLSTTIAISRWTTRTRSSTCPSASTRISRD